jgi:hypothetical protein
MAEVFSPKRITVRDCNLGKKQLEDIAREHKQAKVLRFAGIITDAKEEPGKDNNEGYYILTGDFIAVNLVTGDTYQARKAILPNVATNPILDVLSEGKKVKAVSIRVAVDIAVCEFAPRNPDGLKYKFVASALIKPSKRSVLQDVLDSIELPMPKLLGAVSEEPASEGKGKKK